MTVLQVCAFAAPYEGNFIKSLKALSVELEEKGYKQIYAFPESAKELEWCKELEQAAKVYYLPLAKARIKPSTYVALKRIYRENPDIKITHSHFELYDIPVALTAPKHVKIFWHLHDAIQGYTDMRSRIIHLIQYRFCSKRAILLSVAKKHMDYVCNLGFKKENAYVLLNGLDTERITQMDVLNREKPQYDFLTFGWAFDAKGIPIIIDACSLLYEQDLTVRLLLNGISATWDRLHEYTNGQVPAYITTCETGKDVNVFYQKVDCFVLASKMETFSYSVCEAAYAGLKILCADIPEMDWAKELPSVIMFNAEDANDLMEKMKEVRQMQMTSDCVQQTRRIIEEKYSVSCWVKKVMSFYEV